METFKHVIDILNSAFALFAVVGAAGVWLLATRFATKSDLAKVLETLKDLSHQERDRAQAEEQKISKRVDECQKLHELAEPGRQAMQHTLARLEGMITSQSSEMRSFHEATRQLMSSIDRRVVVMETQIRGSSE